MQYSTIPFEVKVPSEAFVFSPHSLYARLHKLTDQRDRRGKMYPCAPLLTIAVLVKLLGHNQISALADWAKLRAKELSQLFGLKSETMPHLTTWGRVLGKAVDPQELEQIVDQFFRDQLSQQIPERGSLLLNLDGKTLRGSIPAGHSRGVHLLAAYLPDYGVVLGQVAVESKENEIVAAPRLLAQLDLRGMVVSGDAMHTQKKLSVQIVNQGGDYVWFVKQNQPELLQDIELLFEPVQASKGFSVPKPDFRSYSEVDCGHGRIEKRQITVSSMVVGYTPWPHLEQVFKLERWVTRGKSKVTRQEVAYGITSLPAEVAGPKRLLELGRRHWGIENKLHYRRDATLREDWCQLRQGEAQEVNAILNNVVLGLLGLRGVKNVAKARRELEYKPLRALAMLTSPVLSSD